jgi:quercetin dioxygenase-like cupin family protein
VASPAALKGESHVAAASPGIRIARSERSRARGKIVKLTHPHLSPQNATTENDMQITKNSIETTPGPGAWFTGAVYIDSVATPSEPSRVQAASVHFTPGARTAWHTHPNGQTIYVTDGIGLCQSRGGPIEVIRPGDHVFFGAGEDHWHGAAPNRLMSHLAIQQVDDQGNAVTWGDHVADEEYNAPHGS